MDLSKVQIRTLILFHHQKKIKQSECLKELKSTFGDNIVQKTTVKKYYRQFDEGNFNCEDKERSGRPSLDILDQITEVLENYSSATSEDIALEVGVSASTVTRRLHEAGYKSILDKWVPHQLSEINKIKRINTCELLLERSKEKNFLDRIVTCDEKWIYYNKENRKRKWVKPGGEAGQVAKCGLSNQKVMLCIWWSNCQIIYLEFLKSGQTVNSDLYCQMLTKVDQEIKKKMPSVIIRQKILFHQDNAKPHTSLKTRKHISTLNWLLLEHPPYSPDIVPSDFYLFRHLQNYLNGANYHSEEEVKNEVSPFFHQKRKNFLN
jgi:histone-lysine N-methyltransferase SETMAR